MTSKDKTFEISYQQQKYCTVLISLGFLLIFAAFSPLQTVITKLYQNFGFQFFGPITIGIIYVTYGFFTSFASSIIKNHGYKKVLICGSLAYTLFDASGLIIYKFGNNVLVSWLAVIIPAFLCGLAASCIWVAQSSYIGHLTEVKYRDQMFGIFVGIRSFAMLLGYILNYYLLAYFSQQTYFYVFITIGSTSTFFFCILPYTKQIEQLNTEEIQTKTLKNTLIQYFTILTIKQHFQIYKYISIPGLIGAFSAVMLYKIGLNTIPSQESFNSNEEFVKAENYHIGVFLLFFGLSQTIMGFLMKNVAKIINCYEICYYGSLFCFLLSIATVFVYFVRIFILDCFIAFLWGLAFSANRSNNFSLISKVFHNNLDMYAVSNFFGAMSFAAFLILISLALQLSINIGFALLIIAFAFITKSSSKIFLKYNEKNQNGINQILLQDINLKK